MRTRIHCHVTSTIPDNRSIESETELISLVKAVVDLCPEAVSSKCFRKLAVKLLESVPKDDLSGSLQLFWKHQSPP